MAKNEPNKPDDVKTMPENEAPAEESNAPATTPPEIAGDTPANGRQSAGWRSACAPTMTRNTAVCRWNASAIC